MSLVEVLHELKRIRGKFLKDEGIYIFSKPNLVLLPEYTTSVTPIETDFIDLSAWAGPKLFLFNNEQDVPVYVDVYACLFVGGKEYPIRTDIEVPANDFRFGILRDRHRIIKLKFRSPSEPSSGKFQPLILTWSL
ncbi:hypothetical protein J7K27_02470 [Candidatus Bathyarchaeota archaeon]|nr:hypothetical protein [Candidatus Bathyarchaeota archaeon]